jgi:hypothetical protein
MKLLRSFSVLMLALTLLAACDSSEKSMERKLVELGSADGCDAAVQVCLLTHEGAELRLELAKDIRTLQPFQLQLHIAGIRQPIKAVNVEFFMEGMEMGLNRYRLLPGENGWHGEITLPVCVAGRSDWRVVVDVSTQELHYRGVFRFHSSG